MDESEKTPPKTEEEIDKERLEKEEVSEQSEEP